MDFMIEFKTLVIKAETDNMHTSILLKKNVKSNIIKTILEYLPIVAPETFKEWKMVIILVEQGYKSTESQHNYRTGTEITYEGRRTPMEIGKSKNNYDKDGKPRCFNCNIYEYIANDCQKPKKKRRRLESATNTTK